MKTTPLLLAMVVACTNRPSPHRDEAAVTPAGTTAILLDELEGHWENLTPLPDGSWIVYIPCDADNAFLTLYKDTLLIGWGQDVSVTRVEEITPDTQVPGRYRLTAYSDDNPEKLILFWEWANDEQTLLRCWFTRPDQEFGFFVREDNLEQYAVFEQPCHECWEDCDEESPDGPLR
jgi:hypothetical protein